MPLVYCVYILFVPYGTGAWHYLKENYTFTGLNAKYTLENFARTFIEAAFENQPLWPFLGSALQPIEGNTLTSFLNLNIASNIYILHPLKSRNYYCVPIYFTSASGYWNELFLLIQDMSNLKVEEILDLELSEPLSYWAKPQGIAEKSQFYLKSSHSFYFIGIYITFILLILFVLPRDGLVGLILLAYLVLAIVEDIRINKYQEYKIFPASFIKINLDILQIRKVFLNPNRTVKSLSVTPYARYLETIKKLAYNQPIHTQWADEHPQGRILTNGAKFYLYKEQYLSRTEKGRIMTSETVYHGVSYRPLYAYIPKLILRNALLKQSWKFLRLYVELFPYDCDGIHAIFNDLSIDLGRKDYELENIIEGYKEQCF